MLCRILRDWFALVRCNRRPIAGATRTGQSHSTAHSREPGSLAPRRQVLASGIQDLSNFMRASPGEFIANTSVLENCSAELVSADCAIDRAYHDPGNSAALRLTKEMYQ